MTLKEMILVARQKIKVTHTSFTDDEYLTMKGNIIVFECGAKIFIKEWSEGKDYLLEGWSIYVDPKSN